MTGKIKKLVQDRGFGFITPSDNSKDIFFHASGVEGTDFEKLREGQAVTFETEEAEKGTRAVEVRVA